VQTPAAPQPPRPTEEHKDRPGPAPPGAAARYVGRQTLLVVTTARDLALCRAVLPERRTGATLGDMQLRSHLLNAGHGDARGLEVSPRSLLQRHHAGALQWGRIIGTSSCSSDDRQRNLRTDPHVDHKPFMRPERNFAVPSSVDSVGKGRHKDLQSLRREAGRQRFGPKVQRHKRALILMPPDEKQ
jgi:hypothetical protein